MPQTVKNENQSECMKQCIKLLDYLIISTLMKIELRKDEK